MRRAWPPVYRPAPQQQKVVSAAAVPPPPQPPTARYRHETVASAAAGACYIIAAPCSCPQPTVLTGRNRKQSQAVRGGPPPLPARNGCPYRCCAAPSKPLAARPQHQQFQQLQQHSPPLLQNQLQQQRRCAYVRPRPSRSLENLLRVVELDETVTPNHQHQHRGGGIYEKSFHGGGARRKMKVPGKENRHAWKRRSMESLLSARDKNVEFFYHVSAVRVFIDAPKRWLFSRENAPNYLLSVVYLVFHFSAVTFFTLRIAWCGYGL